MDQSLLESAHLPTDLLQTMLHNEEKAMLWRLLGLLVLSSLGSAMLRLNTTTMESSEEDGSTMDPNTFHLRSLDEGEMPSVVRNMPLHSPPAGLPWPPKYNMTDGSNEDKLRMMGATGPGMPPMPDMAICDMLMNAPEPPSMGEIPLFCLCSHCKGTAGPKGDRGDRGPPGAPGSPGRRGMTGFRGRPGFMGSQGIKGQKGDLGEKGQSGATGFTGMKGARGFKGEKGERGVVGPAGPQGPQGETGTCPASCESVQGPPGSQGVPGPVGARGRPGVQGPMAPKGLKGNKGDMGEPGDPGLNGKKGDQGEQGVCDCKDGADGDDGKPGERGAKGEKGDTGAQGVKGPMGLKGNQGDMGLMGPPGPCSPAIQSAFSARIDKPFPMENFPVPFPHVLTNRQGHFNSASGIYMAPVNGTYVFSFHLAVAERVLKVGLFVNHSPKVIMTEVTDKSTTSQTVVLHLSMGDRVWLQVKSSTTNGMYTDNESSSTFSGYLLHPDSCEFPMGRHFHMPVPTDDEVYTWDGAKGTTTPSPQ